MAPSTSLLICDDFICTSFQAHHQVYMQLGLRMVGRPRAKRGDCGRARWRVSNFHTLHVVLHVRRYSDRPHPPLSCSFFLSFTSLSLLSSLAFLALTGLIMHLKRYLARYHDYMPLNAHATPKSTVHYNSKILIIFILLIVSISLNVNFVVRSWMSWLTPLDDYQNLYVYVFTSWSSRRLTVRTQEHIPLNRYHILCNTCERWIRIKSKRKRHRNDLIHRRICPRRCRARALTHES